MQNRIHWIDYAKFIGIFLVVLGHTSIPVSVVNFIYAFHMPLFFFISGFLFVPEKFNSLNDFMRRRAKQLLVPYLFFNIITYLFWFFVGRKFGNDATMDISPITPLIGIFYGVDTGYYLIHCGSLWFLPCLFVVEILYFIFYPKANKNILLIIYAIVGYLNYKLHHVMLPFSFDVALIGLVFYAIGNLSHGIIGAYLKFKLPYRLLTCVLTFFLLLWLSVINGRTDMSSNTYSNYALFLITSLVGIAFVSSFSGLMGDLFREINFIVFFAKSTIVILALHQIAGSLLKGIMYFVFKIPVETFNSTLFLNVMLTVVTFIVLAPVAFGINRYFPFVVGHNIKNKML